MLSSKGYYPGEDYTPQEVKDLDGGLVDRAESGPKAQQHIRSPSGKETWHGPCLAFLDNPSGPS